MALLYSEVYSGCHYYIQGVQYVELLYSEATTVCATEEYVWQWAGNGQQKREDPVIMVLRDG